MATRNEPAPKTLALRPHDGAVRCVVGVAASRDGNQLSAALVGAAGFGADAAPRLLGAATAELPATTRQLMVAADRSATASASVLKRLSADVADVAAATIDRLFGDQNSADSVLAVGIDDTLSTISAPARPDSAAAPDNRCDTARLAELTGHNIVDHFAARDIARGGRGGPLYPMPYWLWFADRRGGGGRTRLLVELGQQATLTHLPPHRSGPLAPAISIETGACSGPVQIVEYIASVVERRDPERLQISGLILAGPQRSDALLLRAVASRLPITLMPLPEFGIDESSLDAACAALLALLHVDQTPANIPEITGARSARVLGRLTPGNPARWRRLLLSMAERNRHMLPLRSAV